MEHENGRKICNITATIDQLHNTDINLGVKAPTSYTGSITYCLRKQWVVRDLENGKNVMAMANKYQLPLKTVSS